MVLYKHMVKRVLMPALVVMLLVGACTSPTPPNPTEGPATATIQEILIVPTSTSLPEQIVQEEPTLALTDIVETPEAACPGEDINGIGQGIADEYEFSGYKEVMSWFCDGAEFEDILVALQTEDQTGVQAEEMLVMLAEGLSWEDIWLVVDLME
jgi:hypothetical protein